MNFENKKGDDYKFTTGDPDFDRRFSDAQSGLGHASGLRANSEATNIDHANLRAAEVHPNDIRRSGMWTEHDAMLASIEEDALSKKLRTPLGVRVVNFLTRRKKS